MIKKRFVVFMMLLAISFVSMDVWATNIEDAQRRQREINQNLGAVRAELVNTRNQISAATEELFALEYAMALAVEELEGIKFELAIMESRLEQGERDLEEAKIIRDRQFDAFVQRSRHIYMNGWMGYVDAVLGADSFTDLLNRIDHVNRIIEFDRNLVQELQRAEENIAVHVENTQSRRDDLAVLESIHTAQVRAHDELMMEKAALLEELEQDAAGYLAAIAEMEADEREIQRAISAFQAEAERQRIAQQRAAQVQRPFVHDGRSLQWPVSGRGVNSGYGNRTDPFTGRTSFHTGVDIPAPLGTNIFAAEAGTVVFSGWMGGYGNTIIIDHGNGMQTLYGHASSLLVGNGATVTRGQTIARVGSTGRSTGNHLHFEVRINGSHTNPMNFTSP
ncbi:MAG: peptidoglycan DD-metalloendopeptidase family protein [Defluviitaleaceae bacterium]|nr:peptidoglycan DD-metalloendopeptidase family protein [Defluviitaleaceae bacterium]